mmetsp:Transcript_7795/g.7726  ORF Transcript_7795/g.7726 Transcript_7795/m.7726 type:complete len:418 (+) Transcript_7795:25-1278(+)
MTLSILPQFNFKPPICAGHGPPYNATVNPEMLLDGFYLSERLQLKHKIGAGTYGLIYLVEDLMTGQQFAAKMILTETPSKVVGSSVEENKRKIKKVLFDYFKSNQRVNSNELNLDYIRNEGLKCSFLREIALHLRVHQHPNVITIHKVISLDNIAVAIIMDYYEQGDLFDNIVEKRIFTYPPYYQDKQTLMKNVMLQLIDAINFCKNQGIYHCDLKPENIMIRYQKNFRRTSKRIIDYNEVQVVLIDFGLAMDSDIICCNTRRGSSFYMAPERITNYTTSDFIKERVDLDQYTSIKSDNPSSAKYFPTLAGDIWSLGVLFLNITCAKNPWPSASIEKHNGSTVFQSYLNDEKVLSSIFTISINFNSILARIFKLNPTDRISLEALVYEIAGCDLFNNVRAYQLPTPVDSEEDDDDII